MPSTSRIIHVANNTLSYQRLKFTCAVGKAGIGIKSSEGDDITPIGTFALRECWYREDKLSSAPKTNLPLRIITQADGWCDDPASSNYNKHIHLPSEVSHETLWRDDNSYDIIVPLGYNDDPIVPGKGSAIFLHVERDGYRPTQGCIALGKEDLLVLLAHCDVNTVLEVEKA